MICERLGCLSKKCLCSKIWGIGRCVTATVKDSAYRHIRIIPAIIWQATDITIFCANNIVYLISMVQR